MKDSDSAFKALADPTRREILKLLQEKAGTPGELVSHFKMTKPTLSHHLDILKRAGLIMAERRGQNIVYTLNATVADEVLLFVMEMFGGKQKKGGKKHV